jgi:superfamily II DNA or RNA helicase
MSSHELLQVKEFLTYTDKSVQFEITQFKKNRWYVDRYGQEAYNEHLDILKGKVKVCLLNQDNGQYWCLSGVQGYFEDKFHTKTDILFDLPTPKPMAYEVDLPFQLYPYQIQATDKLLKNNLSRVELCTGSGKSLCILSLVQKLGLKTVVMSPSTSISDQLYQDFSRHLGKSNVGKFYDGKKEYKKKVVIANAQSLTKVEPESEAWDFLSKVQVFAVDEAHTLPASTFEKVAVGVLANAPYRYFFSATQIRGDGSGKLLDCLTGPTVASLTSKEAMDAGYIAKVDFKIIQTHSPFQVSDSADPNRLTRTHLYYNPVVLKQAAALINASVDYQNASVLVLIDEIEQFTRLLPLLNHPVGFAHGPLGENKSKVPPQYHPQTPNEVVADFNAKKFPTLIGTSCVSTGTNLKVPTFCLYLKGGKSEVELRQGVGRCVRLSPGKTSCTVVDFDVVNVPTLHRHSLARAKIMEDIYPSVQYLDFPVK